MANEASIVIPVELDDKKAQAALNKLNRDIQKTQDSISKGETQHNAIAEQLQKAQQEAVNTLNRIDELKAAMAENESVLNFNTSGKEVDANQFADALAKRQELSEELKKQEELLARQEKEAIKLESQDQKVLDTLREQTQQLEQQKEQAGDLQKQIVSAGSKGLKSIKEDFEGINNHFKKSLTSIVKWGFGIRSLFVLVNRLRNATKEAVMAFAESDAETKETLNGLKSSLATLKASWGAAFAPIINAVAPLLQTLIGWVNSAVEAISALIAKLSGKSTYKRAIANQNALAGGISGTGNAAEKAQKQLAGFDEITRLDDNKGGGGGGGAGGSGVQYEEAAISDSIAGIAQRISPMLEGLKWYSPAFVILWSVFLLATLLLHFRALEK